MADAADTTTAPAGQAVLTIADLNITVNHEPRVEDVRLAEALGMDRPRDIRKLIERHRSALDQLGTVCATVAQTSLKGGRPGRTFWLNKRHCLYLCTKSETERATEVTIQMVEVFDQHLRGTLPPLKSVEVKGHRRALPRSSAPETPGLIPVPDRDGLAMMRIGGELVTVDLQSMPIGGGRSVVFDFNGNVSIVEALSCWPHRNWHGRRIAETVERLPVPGSPGCKERLVVWIIGSVIESGAARGIDGETQQSKARAKPIVRDPRKPLAGRLGDLRTLQVHGTA